MRFKSSYKVYILGFPSSNRSGSPTGLPGFWTKSVHQYLHWRKMPEETSGDTSLSLFPQQSVLVSSFQQHWQRCVCVCSFVFVCVSECSSGSDPSTGESSVEKHHTDWISRQSEMNTDHFLDVVTADCSSWRTRQRFASSVSTQNPSQEQDSAVWLFDYVRQATPNLFIVQTSLTNQMSIFLCGSAWLVCCW